MTAKDEIEVEVPEVEGAAAPETQVITPEEGIDDLKRKLAAEQSARADAERRAQQAQAEAYKATSNVEDTNLTLVKTAIESTKRDRDALKANYAAAMSNGDFNTAADIQQAMADTAAKLLQLENGREAMESRPRQPAPQPQRQDPVEALAAQLSPRSAAWVRAHPQYATDQRLFQKMIAAHNLIAADGVQPDTDDYFSGIESVLGLNSAEAPLSAAAAPAQRRSPPAAAPVGRGSGTRSNVVRLTAEEREIAAMMGMKDEDYARNKQELKAAGRMN